MQVKVDTVDKWEDVLESVDKDQVPINCVKKVFFKLRGGKQKTINLFTLRKQGLEVEDIEYVITRKIAEFGPSIVSMDFVIDVNAVAEHVQPLTDSYLKKI